VNDDFSFDLFLSHSAKDKAVVRPLAERLRQDGLKVWFDEWVLKPGDSIPAKIEEGLERSRVLVLCMSANGFGSDWAQLESGTFRFRDPLNKERRFLPLRLDDAPIKGSLTQFLYINWLPEAREHEYAKLIDACRPNPLVTIDSAQILEPQRVLRSGNSATWVAISHRGDIGISGGMDSEIWVWDLDRGVRKSLLSGHDGAVLGVSISADGGKAVSSSHDGTIRIWDVTNAKCIHTIQQASLRLGISGDGGFVVSPGGTGNHDVRVWDADSGELVGVMTGHTGRVTCVAISFDGRVAVSGSEDLSVIVWDVSAVTPIAILRGHTAKVMDVAITDDGTVAVSCSRDRTVQLWKSSAGDSVRIFEGHTGSVRSVTVTPDGSRIVSGGDDAIRIWEPDALNPLIAVGTIRNRVVGVAVSADGRRAISGSFHFSVTQWELPQQKQPHAPTEALTGQLYTQYTNAKVLVVGDTHAGKTGLAYRLANDEWKPSDESTVGAWATQWKLKHGDAEPGVDREIWLWDFGGQADQRLIHQLYMDRTALILLLFNSDQEDVLPGLRDWQTALRRAVKTQIPHFLVAGRIDTGFKASRGKLQAFAQEQGLAYHETSAKSGDGCDELRAAMIAGIPWAQMEKRTSPRIFKLIKDEILKLRDEGQVLHTFKELRELLWRRLPDEPRFTDEILQTVVGLLDGPGVVKELDYGTYILLAPEWINAYAQAVIRTLRSAENDLGVLPLRSIAEGKLIYQSIGRDGVPVAMKRLPPAEERVVLGEMERQLEQRGLCLRQGDKLVFPSHCGRDRPAVLEHPSVFVSYAVKGFLDDIYATLVVKLADSESFQLKELWRDAADFVTLADDRHMGIKLTRETASDGDISVYFGKGVTQQEQVIFANYIHAHLQASCELAQRLRHYVCPECHAPKGNPEVLMKKLLREKQNADTECDGCGGRFPLWDALEKKFASEAVRAQVEQLQADDLAKLDTRRRGKLLALEVGARITSADQKCFEIPATEDEGLDMELEFTNDDGEGTGCRLYLQLKSGNSHLTKRKTDGAEIFTIKKQRWVKYWLQQPHPVMLVIGTFSEDDERSIGKHKMEFAEVRWMEISSVLQRESANGTKPVKQIEFKGERLDLSNVRRWREKVLKEQIQGRLPSA